MDDKSFDLKKFWKKISSEKNPDDYTKEQIITMYESDIKRINWMLILLVFASLFASYSLSASIHEKACNEFLFEQLEINNPYQDKYNFSTNVNMKVVPMTNEISQAKDK